MQTGCAVWRVGARRVVVLQFITREGRFYCHWPQMLRNLIKGEATLVFQWHYLQTLMATASIDHEPGSGKPANEHYHKSDRRKLPRNTSNIPI